MNILIIGYGSIGQRHARLYKQLGCSVGIVTKRLRSLELAGFEGFETLPSALEDRDWDLVVISNKTSEHYQALVELVTRHHPGIILIEKPMLDMPVHLSGIDSKRIFVAYNMRFHPLVQQLRELLLGQRLLSVQMYVGQYLPTWRPGRDYTQNYSSSKDEGGGVLKDLSHELDLMQWLFGKWLRMTAIGGKYSHLEGDSDDLFSLLVETESCPMISLHMNYLDRLTQRTIVVNTDHFTVSIDLINGMFKKNQDELSHVQLGRDDLYIYQNRAVLNGDYSTLCTYEEGMEVVKIISAAEKAANERVWVYASDLHDMC